MYSRLFQDNPDDSEILVNYIAVLLSDNRIEEAQGQLLLLKQRFPDNSSIEKLQEKIFSDADKDSEKIDSSSTSSDRPSPEKSAENLKEPDVSDSFPEYNTEFQGLAYFLISKNESELSIPAFLVFSNRNNYIKLSEIHRGFGICVNKSVQTIVKKLVQKLLVWIEKETKRLVSTYKVIGIKDLKLATA